PIVRRRARAIGPGSWRNDSSTDLKTPIPAPCEPALPAESAGGLFLLGTQDERLILPPPHARDRDQVEVHPLALVGPPDLRLEAALRQLAGRSALLVQQGEPELAVFIHAANQAHLLVGRREADDRDHEHLAGLDLCAEFLLLLRLRALRDGAGAARGEEEEGENARAGQGQRSGGESACRGRHCGLLRRQSAGTRPPAA